MCHIDGLVQERHNSSALAMELCLSCINPSISSLSEVACAKTLKGGDCLGISSDV